MACTGFCGALRSDALLLGTLDWATEPSSDPAGLHCAPSALVQASHTDPGGPDSAELALPAPRSLSTCGAARSGVHCREGPLEQTLTLPADVLDTRGDETQVLLAAPRSLRTLGLIGLILRQQNGRCGTNLFSGGGMLC